MKKAKAIASGLPAGPGAASGKIYLNADRAAAAAEKGEKVLLVRNETSPEDLRGMIAAEGILTAKGGVSSHAALVARQMGKVCICGASGVADRLREEDRHASPARLSRKAISSRSTAPAGTVYAGQLATAPSEIITGMLHGDKAAQKTEKFKAFKQLMKWCAQGRAPRSPQQRRQPGADRERPRLRRGGHRPHPHGAHVLRRRPHRRHARNDPGRQRRGSEKGARETPAVSARGFRRHLQGAEGLPATIRFLDPPLHEFLPHDAESQADLGEEDRRQRGEDRAARRAAARIQSDARPSRLPARHRVSRRSPRCRRARSSKRPRKSRRRRSR